MGVVAVSAGVLPAAPLLRALEMMAREQHAGVMRRVCERVGITDRTVRRWRSGESTTVTIELADRVLSRSPWHWFDIWKACRAHPHVPEPECTTCGAYTRAAQAFDSVRPGL